MKIEIVSEKDFSQITSDLLKQLILKRIDEKDSITLGLPGGRSISSILSHLKKESLPWKHIDIFMVDERFVPIDNVQSNFQLISKELAGILPKENLHPFIYKQNVEDSGLKAYTEEIKKYGGYYDIILLSSGEDGHIASLFPTHPALFNESEYYVLVENSPKPPPTRISVSKNFIKKSPIGMLLFAGLEKKIAFERFVQRNHSFEQCPAVILQEVRESYVITTTEHNNVENNNEMPRFI